MKLALPLLLVTLALCCSDANAGEVCPALKSEITKFLLGTRESFKNEIKKVGAPEEAIQAKLKVKTCTDKLPLKDRLAVAHFVKIVDFVCKRKSE